MSEAAAPDELDDALAAVEQLPDAPLTDHVTAFERVHAVLTDRLGDADAGR